MPNAPPKHRPPGMPTPEEARRTADAQRAGTEQKKARNLRAYRRFRAQFILDNPTCQDCGRRQAEHCHHTRKLAVHLEDLVDPEYCRALCRECHSVRTGRGE